VAPGRQKRKTIVWDVDDVLNNLMEDWLEQRWRPDHAGAGLSYEDLVRNPPDELLGVSRREYTDSLDAFRGSDAGRRMRPVGEVVKWFGSHGQEYHHVALTARPIATIPETARWVFQHFGAWIRSFAFVPSPRPGDPSFTYDVSKAELLARQDLGDLFVDDDEGNIEGVAATGRKTLMIPRPWNRAAGNTEDALRRIRDLLT
jgi:hypothetical protein